MFLQAIHQICRFRYRGRRVVAVRITPKILGLQTTSYRIDPFIAYRFARRFSRRISSPWIDCSRTYNSYDVCVCDPCIVFECFVYISIPIGFAVFSSILPFDGTRTRRRIRQRQKRNDSVATEFPVPIFPFADDRSTLNIHALIVQKSFLPQELISNRIQYRSTRLWTMFGFKHTVFFLFNFNSSATRLYTGSLEIFFFFEGRFHIDQNSYSSFTRLKSHYLD